MSRRILVVDDEEAIRRSLAAVLQDERYEVVLAESGEKGIKAAEAEDPDLVLLDVWLPGMDGIEVLGQLKEKYPGLPVLIMSGHGTIETAVRATKLGAYDFIEKPLNLDKMLLTIDHAFNASRLAEENRFLRDRATRGREMIGECPAMQELKEQIRLIAPTRATVLITGENGTGKELVAQAIHAQSTRAGASFVEMNCAAIPENLIESELFGHEKGAFTGAAARRRGKFDMADGGTLFLDEIGDMSLPTQAKILRVLQEMRFERVGGGRTHVVDVRVIAATNKDLEEEIRAGRFREDLYFRLNVVPIELPPIRERKEDIRLLVRYFTALSCEEYGKPLLELSEEAMGMLAAYDWPGNVREIKNIAERMVIMCRDKKLEVRHVPPAILAAVGQSPAPPAADAAANAASAEALELPLKEARREFEKSFLLGHLEKNGWNVALTANAVGLDRSGLYKKMKELGIEPRAG